MKKLFIVLLIVGTFVASYRATQRSNAVVESELQARERIVTIAPSSGEVLFALGLGDQVVGVSRFMKYPPEAANKSPIGGYLDVDLEALVSLQPDVVVLLKEQSELAQQLEGMGMQTLSVDHMSVDGIIDSIKRSGAYFDVERQAAAMITDIRQRIQCVSESTQSQSGVRVLLSIGREVGKGKVNGLVAAGIAGYHQELLALAHAENAYKGEEKFPQLSREHLITMNPEVIIDMINSAEAAAVGVDKIKADWATHSELQAVRNGRIYLLVGDQHFVPGPRFIETLEWIGNILTEDEYDGR